ncbi:MAG TPA: cell surface protein, partial [Pirellulales bacterium]|nr:cell surface protein [Pirellulales bacterium]
MAVALSASAARAGDVPAIKLEAFPPDVQLTTSRDRQSFIVVATRPDGVTQDVTASATATLANPALARIDGHTLYPTADGATTLALAWQGQTVTVPVTVKDAAVDRPISFRLDVMPVFMRSGCNTGSCHGAARGKDGFNLSLFGYDPNGDYHRITHEIGFRRINLALPRESLLMMKTDGSVPHTGGKRFAGDSDYYQTLLRWLESGVPKDPDNVATVVGLEVFPPKAVLEGEGTTQQFIARAKYSDGTDRDVTNLAVFMTNNDNSAPIDADGLVTAAARGEAFIMARFATQTVGCQVLVLPKDLQYTPPTTPPANYIDELVG